MPKPRKKGQRILLRQQPAEPTRLTPTPHPHLRKLLIRLPRFLWLLALASVSIGAALIEAWPHVQVRPPVEPFDSLEPYKYPFRLENDGSLPIFDVHVQCYPKHVTFELFRTANIAAEVGAFQFIADQIASGDWRPFNRKGWKWFTGKINGMNFSHRVVVSDNGRGCICLYPIPRSSLHFD